MRMRCTHRSIDHFFGLLILFFTSVSVQAGTSIQSLTADPPTITPLDSVSFTLTLATDAKEYLSAEGTLTLYRGRTPVFRSQDPDFINVTLPSGIVVKTFTVPPSAYDTPGDYRLVLDLIGYGDNVLFDDSAEARFQVQDVPITLSPPSLSLQGKPGETVQGSFQVTGGIGPFSLSADQGSLTPSSVGLNQPVTYRFSIPADATPGTRSDTIRVVSQFGSTAQIPVTIQVQDVPITLSPPSLSLQGKPGETVQGSFQVTGGIGPFSLSADQGSLTPSSVGLNQPVTYRFSIPADATPGTRSDTIRVVSRSGDSATLPVHIGVNAPPAQEIIVQPARLQLSGKAGETPTATFQITAGAAPFQLSSAHPDQADFSNATPGLNEPVTYRFRIPNTLTEPTTLTDTLSVLGADGVRAQVPVTISVQGTDQGPTQAEIDEAMQSIAQTPPQRATAAAISTLCPKGVAQERLQKDCDLVVGAALGEDRSQAAQALGQVTADQASTPVNAAQTSIQAQIRNLSTRIAALRGGITGLSLRGLSVNLNGQRLPITQLADLLNRDLMGGGAGGDTSLSFGPWGFFINGSYSSGDKDRTANAEGFNSSAAALTLGADYRFRENLIAGIALGYGKDTTDLDQNGGRLDTTGYSLSLYGTYYQDDGLYLDGILTYGWNDYDQDRRIRYRIGSVTVDQTAFAGFNGNQFSASFGGGYSFARGPWSFGPTARLEYVKTKVDGYQERMSDPQADGGGWAVGLRDQEVEFFHSQLGAEVAYAISTTWGILQPNAQVEWIHEFQDGGDFVVGHFVLDPSQTTFSLPTDTNDKDYYNLRLGISAQFAQGRSAFLYYRQLFGYSDLNAYTIGGGLRFEF